MKGKKLDGNQDNVADAAEADNEQTVNPALLMMKIGTGDIEGAIEMSGIIDERGNFNFAGLLATLDALEKAGILNEDTIRALADQPYEQVAEKIRPLVACLPIVTEKVGQDLIGPIANIVYGLSNGLADNPEFAANQLQSKERKAKSARESIDAYKEQGFSEEAAFQLLVLDRQATVAAMCSAPSAIGNMPKPSMPPILASVTKTGTKE